MSEYRHSIWEMMIARLREEIADIGDQERWPNPKLKSALKDAIMDLPSIGSSAVTSYVPFNFEPAMDGGIREDLYENYSNVVTNYYLALDESTTEGYLETRAYSIPSKQIVLVTMFWVSEGTANEPTLDISLNKDPSGDENRPGTFLVNDGRISTIVKGRDIDVSMIPSSSFSFKWSFPANSDYKVRETMAEIMLVDMYRLRDELGNVVKLAAANIFQIHISEATKRGASTGHMDNLQRKYETLIGDVRGNVGKGVSMTSKIGSIEGYDRSTYAEKAFGRKTAALDGQWVEVTGNTIVGRTIRIIPD